MEYNADLKVMFAKISNSLQKHLGHMKEGHSDANSETRSTSVGTFPNM